MSDYTQIPETDRTYIVSEVDELNLRKLGKIHGLSSEQVINKAIQALAVQYIDDLLDIKDSDC